MHIIGYGLLKKLNKRLFYKLAMAASNNFLA